MVIACQVILGISRRGCTFLLSMVNYIIQLTLLRSGPNLSQRDEKLLADIPADPRGAEARFNLMSEHTIYAVCPNVDCHKLYKPKFVKGSPIPIYQAKCSHRQFRDGPECGTLLLKSKDIDGTTIALPIKPFAAFCFRDWLGALLSRPGFEEKMDKAWVRCNRGDSGSDEMEDILDGEILQNFCGPDGKHFSIRGTEGRYVFSLGMDFFNPLGNKQAGKKKSVGMISLVCLNLPIELRYLPENMFLLGVIPGPREPPLACSNHYLTPMVDALEDFWSPGVQYSRTNDYYYGRVVRAAVVCVVCDLLAARKAAGFASVCHTQMCAMCHCTRKSHGLGNTDTDKWERRTKEECQDASKRYLQAVDEDDRKAIFAETGIRWTELLRLPYFDPSRFVVVDAMHNLFLGLTREHFDILGIRMDDDDNNNVVLNIFFPEEATTRLNANEQKTMKRLTRILKRRMNSDLKDTAGHAYHLKKVMKVHQNTLKAACDYLSVKLLPFAHANKTKVLKVDYAKALLQWVSH